MAGGIAGFVAGALAFAAVHLTAAAPLLRPITAAAEARGVSTQTALLVAYGTTAALGSIVGATFAVVTRYLRKWLPLTMWAVVFFTSLAMLVLAVAGMNGRGPDRALSFPILFASAVYALVVAFSLPIRLRR